MAAGGQPRSQQYVYNDQRGSIFNFGEIGNALTGDHNTGAVTTSFTGQLVQTQDDIAEELGEWSEGMVETSHYHQILQTVLGGERWVTVKGSPGEGKTTCVRMALRQVQKSGRNVFIVRDPGHFQHIAGTYPRAVIVLDDVLGDIEFNISEWERWKGVFHQQLDLKEHRFNGGVNTNSESNGPTVIFISRDYVLNGAGDKMGRLYAVITQESRVINMSHSVDRATDEKQKILKAVVLPHVKLNETEINNILHIDGGHGFPHVCRMFVTMRKSSPSLSPQEFFKKPLTFLNETIKVFIKNKITLSLFKEMLKRQGRLSEREVEQFDTEVKQQAKELLGTYLKIEGGYFIFDHPSVFDSVSFTLGDLHTVFVIENCPMKFLYERIRLQSATSAGNNMQSDNDLAVYISDVYIEDLAKRFAKEIQERELEYVLSHPACTQTDFVCSMMRHVTVPSRSLFQITDKTLFEQRRFNNETDKFVVYNFLSLLAMNKSGEIFRYIESRPDIHLSEEDIKYVLFGVCKHGAIDMLNHLIERGYKLDVHARYGTGHHRLLMVAAANGHSEIMDKLLSLGCDVSAGNSVGRTALHYACYGGRVGIVDKLLGVGVDIESGRKTDTSDSVVTGDGGRVHSPLWHALHYVYCRRREIEDNVCSVEIGEKVYVLSPLLCACYHNNIDVVEFLLSRGARVTEEVERVAREKSNPDIQKLILKDKN